MVDLKQYQERTLEALSAYFDACVRMGDADIAFYSTTRATLGRSIPYTSVQELPGLPYVCVRLPTGGGKTIVGCHAVGVAMKHLLRVEKPVILWLVPSNTIREQTLRALRDSQHSYRQAVERSTGSSISVLTVDEALYVQPGTFVSDTTIIVATLQAFRVDDTEGRRVYESAGALEAHFTHKSPTLLDTLEHQSDGSLQYSLANVLRMHRPIVIVDEAHNARTGLSFETLARLNPSCIIELTATPDKERTPSNVIYSASAAELQAEAMIKMPIQLETHANWRELLADAVGLRSQLEEQARLERQVTGEYIRPIMLIQAQPRNKGQETITVDVIKKCLLDDHNIPEGHIRRATAEANEIEGMDLLATDCDVRYIITVQALREGWDCPFAYVLCSVAELRSSTAVEQILGRILRLPHASFKQNKALNKAYAFAASQNFARAANALTDALVENGFEKQEARDLVVRQHGEQLPLSVEELGLFTNRITIHLPEIPTDVPLPPSLVEKITLDFSNGTMAIMGAMTEQDRCDLRECFVTPQGKAAVDSLYQQASRAATALLTPSERGEKFIIPVIAIQQSGLFEPFEATDFIDTPWDLLSCNAALSDTEFPSDNPHGQHGVIAVSDTGRIRIETEFIPRLQEQMTLLAANEGWTSADLTYWLTRNVRYQDLSDTQIGLFAIRAVRTLLDVRNISLDRLVHDKYRLRDAIAAKVDSCRKQAYTAAYQALLLPESPLVVSPDLCFSFEPNAYPFSSPYSGSYHFKKHYYRQIGDLKSEGEEFECAQFIDALPQVKFWVRNIERRPAHSFWLQTSTDKFYPDFVCLLDDGRYMVVEYKGEVYWSNDDSKEKRDIGGLWEKRSNGRCLFIMPKGKDLNAIKAKF